MKFLLLLQTNIIKDKIKNAPNSGYEIGVFIGSFIPFILLLLVAYLMYDRSKKKNQ